MMIRGIAEEDAVQKVVVSRVRVVSGVVPGFLRGPASLERRVSIIDNVGSGARTNLGGGLPGNGFYTNVGQTECGDRVDGRVGSAAPLWTGEVAPSRAKQLPRAIGRGCSASDDGLDAYKEPIWAYLCLRHIFRTTLSHIEPSFPAPRWFRQGNVGWDVECYPSGLQSLRAVYKRLHFTESVDIAVGFLVAGRLHHRYGLLPTRPNALQQNLRRQLRENMLPIRIYCISFTVINTL